MRKRTAVRALAALVPTLVMLPGTSAAADTGATVVVTRNDGTIVGAGDVVGAGQRSGDTCTFPDEVSVVMTMASGGARTTMRIDEACRVIVETVEPVGSDLGASQIGWSVEPKHPGVVPDSVPFSGGSLLDGAVAFVARVKPKPTPEPEPVKLWTGWVVQTFYAAGQPQWRDRIQLDYAQGINSGTIVTSSIGERTDCAVQPLDPTTTFANVKSNCVYQHTATSGPYAELYGSGDYQQVLLGQVLAAATTKEVFIVTKTDYSGSCQLPVSAPTGWTLTCHSEREQAA